MELIEKAAIVAELKRRINEYETPIDRLGSNNIRLHECKDLLSFLDTLEVKDVDLGLVRNSDKTRIKNMLFQGYRYSIIDILNNSEGKSNEELADEIMVGYETLIRIFKELADEYEAMCKVIGTNAVEKIFDELKNKE